MTLQGFPEKGPLLNSLYVRNHISKQVLEPTRKEFPSGRLALGKP